MPTIIPIHGNPEEKVYGIIGMTINTDEGKEYIKVHSDMLNVGWEELMPPSPTPTQTPTQTPSPTVTQTVTPTVTFTPSVTPTLTVTQTPSVSPGSTSTPTPTPTPAASPGSPPSTPTPTPTLTPTSTIVPPAGIPFTEVVVNGAYLIHSSAWGNGCSWGSHILEARTHATDINLGSYVTIGSNSTPTTPPADSYILDGYVYGLTGAPAPYYYQVRSTFNTGCGSVFGYASGYYNPPVTPSPTPTRTPAATPTPTPTTAPPGTYPLTLTTMLGYGTCTSSPSGTSFAPGTVITVYGIPAAPPMYSDCSGLTPTGVSFSSGPTQTAGANGFELSATFTMPSNAVSVAATFQLQNRTLSVYSAGNGSVTPSVPTAYNYGTLQGIGATANAGYVFDHWEFGGTASDQDGSTALANTVITMIDNRTATAYFAALPTYTVTANNGTGGSSTSFNGNSSGAPITGVLAGEYPISCVPEAGYEFAGWTGGVFANSAANPTSITITGDTSFSSTFTLIP